MTKVKATLWLTGGDFIPFDFANLIDWDSDLSESCASGEVDASTGEVMDYGYVLIRSSDAYAEWVIFEVFLDRIYNKRDLFKEWKIDDVEIHLDVVDDGQCNFQLEAAVLGKIAEIDACLTVTCWRK